MLFMSIWDSLTNSVLFVKIKILKSIDTKQINNNYQLPLILTAALDPAG